MGIPERVWKSGPACKNILVVVICLFFAQHLYAQTITGTILGSVVDPSGAAIANAQVTITSQDTGAMRNAVSTADGAYTVPQLPTGNYTVGAMAQGFSQIQVKNVVVTVGSDTRIDLKLSVGQVSQSVTVTEAIPTVETTSSEVSQTMDQSTIASIPLNARDLLQLSEIQPGVQFNNYDTVGRSLVVDGSRPADSRYLLQGIDTTSTQREAPTSSAGIILGVEAVQEFKVLTSNYSAEYGEHPGGVINTIVKSGTNAFHGSGFEYFRNDAFETRNFFDPATIPSFTRNQFGGSVGGPVKKDNTFFFFNYEGFRQDLGETLTTLVPDVPARSGQLPCSVVTPKPAACTGAPSTALVPVTLSPFVAAAIPVFFPGCAGPDIGGGVCEDINSQQQNINENYYLASIDHSFSPANHVTVTYNHDGSQEKNPDSPDFYGHYAFTRQTAAVQDTEIISPNLVNTVRVGGNRAFILSEVFPGISIPSTIDGSSPYVVQNSTFHSTIPLFTTINVTSLTGLGKDPSIGPEAVGTTMGVVNDDVNYQRGKHAFQFGIEYKYQQDNVTKGSTGGTVNAYTFLSLQSFLSGLASTFTEPLPGSIIQRYWRHSYVGFYGEDTYKFKPNLTLTYGLRWEYASPVSSANGTAEIFLLPQSSTIQPAPHPWYGRTGDFAPRVGFNWDPFKKGTTSVRGGFGTYFDMIDAWYLIQQTGETPPFTKPISLSSVMTWPYNPALLPTNPALTVNSYINPPQPKDPTVYQYNLTVQQELPEKLSLMIGYIGSETRHLARPSNQNDYFPLVETPGSPVMVNGAPLLVGGSAVQNPACTVAGQLTCLYFPTGLTRPNPNYQQVTGFYFDSNADYNALEVALERHVGQGLTLRFNYTHSSCIDDVDADYGGNEGSGGNSEEYAYDRRSSHGRCGFNAPDQGNFNFSYDLPFGRSTDSRAMRALTGGWNISSLTQVSSGIPMNVTLGFSNSRNGDIGAGNDQPNLVAGCSSQNAINPHSVNYINASCFTAAPAGFFGDLPELYLNGPGYWSTDVSLRKNVPLKSEGMGLELRLDVFNIFNHTNFAVPGVSVGAGTGGSLSLDGAGGVPNPAFGKIVSTLGTSRQAQVSARFHF